MARSTFRRIPSASTRRGFSLLEVTIVIGVAGLVVGAIWSAAQGMYERKKVNQADQLILSLMTNIRAYMDETAGKGFGFPVDPACGVGAPSVDVTQAAIQAGVFADQTDLLTGYNDYPARTPWGSGGWTDVFTITTQSYNECSAGFVRTFSLRFRSAIPPSSCAQLIMSHLPEFLDLGLYSLEFGTSVTMWGISNQNYLTVAGGVTPSNITTLCANTDPTFHIPNSQVSIGLEFRYPFSP